MIRPLRKRHSRMIIGLAVAAVLIILWSLDVRPQWSASESPAAHSTR